MINHLEQIPGLLYVIECPFRQGINTTVYVYGKNLKTFIDSGISLSPDYQIIPYLRSQDVDIAQIKELVNTHGHFDHMGGNARLQQVTGCRICAHASDAPWIENHDRHYQEFELKYSKYYPVPPDTKQTFDLASGKPTSVNRLLSDGDKIDLREFSLDVVHTPGHTPGCICLIDKEHKLLFAGDSIQGTGLGSEFESVLPLYEDARTYKDSLRRLLSFDLDLILCAHPFEPYRKIILRGREATGLIEKSLTEVERIERAVLETLKEAESPMSLPEVTRKVPEKIHVQGVPSDDVYVVQAHLSDFVRRGIAQHNKGDDTWVMK